MPQFSFKKAFSLAFRYSEKLKIVGQVYFTVLNFLFVFCDIFPPCRIKDVFLICLLFNTCANQGIYGKFGTPHWFVAVVLRN